MQWLRRHYGAGPLHLVGLLACFAVAAYAVTRIFGQGGWKGIFLWFVFCIIAHDLIGWPIYAMADRVLVRAQSRRHTRRAPAVPWINHVRVPTVVSAVLLGLFFPLIFRLESARFEAITGLSVNVYLTNWLAVTAGLFAASAVIYLLRLALARRQRSRALDSPST
jgi:hypothetical protein